MNIPQPRDRNDKLLDFILRRSVADFKNFIAIVAAHQRHLVPLLADEGEIYVKYNLSEKLSLFGALMLIRARE